MLKSSLMYLAPFGLTLVLAAAARIFGGPERGARAAGIAVVLAFLVAWGVFLKPGWLPGDDFARVGHIAFGAALVGLALDLLSVKRLWVALAGAVVVLVSTWTSVTGSLYFSTTVAGSTALLVAGLALGAFLIVARLDAVRARGITALVFIIGAACGIALMAHTVGDARLASAGFMLALAALGYVLIQSVIAVPVGDSIALGAGAALLALAWALAHGHAAARFPLLLVPLMFFAEGTANRVPLPQARITAILYPLVLGAIAALPLALAVLMTYIAAHA